jgi:hypothetical protein
MKVSMVFASGTRYGNEGRRGYWQQVRLLENRFSKNWNGIDNRSLASSLMSYGIHFPYAIKSEMRKVWIISENIATNRPSVGRCIGINF